MLINVVCLSDGPSNFCHSLLGGGGGEGGGEEDVWMVEE